MTMKRTKYITNVLSSAQSKRKLANEMKRQKFRVCGGLAARDGFAEFAEGSILHSNKTFVAKHPKSKEVIGFLTSYDDSFVTHLDRKPKPIAKQNEYYLDLVCSGARGGGRALTDAFYKTAVKANKDTIRLYAEKNAYDYWSKNGYMECDDACDNKRCHRKQYFHDPDAGVRMTKCLFP